MPNVYAELLQLLPTQPLLVGTVIEIYTGGATVQLPGGAVQRVRGTASVGQHVFFRSGMIEGQAPALDVVEIEV